MLYWWWKCEFQNHMKFITRQKLADAKKALNSLLYNNGVSKFSFEVCFLRSWLCWETLLFYAIINNTFCQHAIIYLEFMTNSWRKSHLNSAKFLLQKPLVHTFSPSLLNPHTLHTQILTQKFFSKHRDSEQYKRN